MKKTGKKRQLLAASLIIALAAAVTVNWYYTKSLPAETGAPETETRMLGDTVLVAGTNVATDGDADETPETAGDEAAFAELQLKQTQANEALEEKLEAVLSNEQLDAEAQTKVTQMLDELRQKSKAQTNCETLIRAKTGGQAIVLLDETQAQVIVERGKLNDQSTLQITEIMAQSGGIPAENLTILEVNS